jgi:putative ABC transport system permease protein
LKPWEALRVAVRALLRNKLRSFLTALGIMIGVGAVIAMVAIGEGARAQVEEAFAAMGTNVLIISAGTSTSHGARAGSGTQPTLAWDDLKAIEDEISTVRRAAPRLHGNGQVIGDERNWTTEITGTTPDFFEIRHWPVPVGRPLTQADVESGAKVAVVGQTVVEQLWGRHGDPVGQIVRIRNVPFEVVGVAARKGQSQSGNDYDDVLFVPVSTYLSKIQGGMQRFITGTIIVGVTSDTLTLATQAKIADLLRDRHHLEPGADDDFQIKNLTETANRKDDSMRALTILLASIAAVSLLVGGIGIMNIMLVSVTERTREIGIRMAVGAKPRDVLAQFLLEALALSVMGGLVGMTLGIVASNQLAARFGWPMLVQPMVVAVALGFSGLVGIAFGLYPARKASRLDPIEALRYE